MGNHNQEWQKFAITLLETIAIWLDTKKEYAEVRPAKPWDWDRVMEEMVSGQTFQLTEEDRAAAFQLSGEAQNQVTNMIAAYEAHLEHLQSLASALKRIGAPAGDLYRECAKEWRLTHSLLRPSLHEAAIALRGQILKGEVVGKSAAVTPATNPSIPLVLTPEDAKVLLARRLPEDKKSGRALQGEFDRLRKSSGVKTYARKHGKKEIQDVDAEEWLSFLKEKYPRTNQPFPDKVELPTPTMQRGPRVIMRCARSSCKYTVPTGQEPPDQCPLCRSRIEEESI